MIRAALKFWGSHETEESPSETAALRLELRSQFCSDDEEHLYQLLSAAAGDKAFVYTKIRVLNVLRIVDASNHLETAIRLDRKYIDFLVCERSTRRPICAVQFDQWNESSGEYQQRDTYLEKAIDAAGLKVIHLRSNKLPPQEMLRQRLAALLDQDSRRKKPSCENATN